MLDRSNNEELLVKEYQDKISKLSNEYGDNAVYEVYWVFMDMMASFKNAQNIAAILEHCKKDPKIRDVVKEMLSDRAYSPLQKAIDTNNVVMIEQLLKFDFKQEQIKSCQPSAIFTLLAQDHQDFYLQFLESGADVNQTGIYNEPLAAFMLKNKKIELFEKFYSKFEKQIDFTMISNEKRSLLHYAAMSGDQNVIDILLKKGLVKNQTDVYGFSPLDYALFYGHLPVAKMLSQKTENELKKDPRYNHPPPEIDHEKITLNFLQYLKIKHLQTPDPDIQFKIPAINEGVCNGWSMLAALRASASDLGVNESFSPLDEHYLISDLLRRWDGQPESLTSIPSEFKDTLLSFDDLFRQFNNDVYWFFQQSDVASGISRHDRKKQLALISDNQQVEPLIDFGLPDLTQKELELILDAYQPIANGIIIDERSRAHDCTYYQNKNGQIHYFDPNMRFQLPLYQNYGEVLVETNAIRHDAHSVAYFHPHPEEIDKRLKGKITLITDKLVQQLILDNPSRRDNIGKIMLHAVHYGLPIFLERILTQPQLNKNLNELDIEKAVNLASVRKTFECLHVLYQRGINLSDFQESTLENLLRTAIQYDNKEMFEDVKKAMVKYCAHKKTDPSSTKRSLMAFQYSNADKSKTNEKVEQKEDPQKETKKRPKDI